MLLDLLLLTTLGFLGSFGHWVGMCGPLTATFSLSTRSQNGTDVRSRSGTDVRPPTPPNKWHQFQFHTLLNLGRLCSYTLTGAGIGALGSVLVASGHLAGIDSDLRRWLAILTGLMLIWFGLAKVQPQLLPKLPIFHPLKKNNLHNRLSTVMVNLSMENKWWTPAFLGLVWGLMPCGFLYAAQIKAAETSNIWLGGATMFAFGLGTLPSMLGVGMLTSFLTADKRSQLFEMAGWVSIFTGIMVVMRNGEMVDYSGSAAILCLIIALVARPLSRFWSQPLRYRRVIGMGAFVLSVAHTGKMLDHSLNWNMQAVSFMLPLHQVGIWAGIFGLGLMLPLALTSFDGAVKYFGKWWRRIHLLSVPAFLLCGVHVVAVGSHYLGALEWSLGNQLRTIFFGMTILVVLIIRSHQFWSLFSIDKYYVPPLEQVKIQKQVLEEGRRQKAEGRRQKV
ncbi:sulfite exporter TauE/SafE family protein [Okeania hirsuta]|uniref:Sulfite exporter TauE/SafE family protein n=1 Tax=Okeania hirsuta TaxID=1458930 RepID=A0A3N6P7F5_9CYAN|nr:sulfite exporter TauE/SafE family protein [Okeania hirsuta]RQH31837.1 sulfite exporter TauE/SafE family protein [Okeania hirsuta]